MTEEAAIDPRRGAIRLRDVGAVTSPTLKRSRFVQLLGEHFDVATIKIEDRLMAQQIHVGSCSVEKDLLSVTCNVSRAPITWLSACGVRLGVRNPLKRFRRGRAELRAPSDSPTPA